MNFLKTIKKNNMQATLVFAFITLLWGSSSLLESCSKLRSKTKAEIAVRDKTTERGIEDVRVVLVGKHFREWGGDALTPLEEQFTDHTGKCTFEFEWDDTYDSYGIAIPPTEGYYEQKHTGISFRKGRKNKETVFLQPEAWLKVYIKNVNPVDGNDKISVSRDGAGGGGVFYGTNIDTFTISRSFGNHTKELYWWVTKNDAENKDSAFIYLIAHDTTEFTIEY